MHPRRASRSEIAANQNLTAFTIAPTFLVQNPVGCSEIQTASIANVRFLRHRILRLHELLPGLLPAIHRLPCAAQNSAGVRMG